MDEEVKKEEGEVKEDAPVSDEILHAFDGGELPAVESEDAVSLSYHPSSDDEPDAEFDLAGDDE